MNKRGFTTYTSIAVPRPTPREGDGSPQLKAEVESKRTDEARTRYAKAIDRQKRRKVAKMAENYAKDGETGLQKLIEQMRGQRGCPPTETADSASLELPYIHKRVKVVRSKPARRITPATTQVRIRRQYDPSTLMRRKNRALLREIRRIFKKVLGFAARQSKKSGYAIYLIILELFCLNCNNLIHQIPQEV